MRRPSLALGAEELTVRLLPVPLVLATVVLIWWLGMRLGGAGVAVIASLGYAIISTDPYMYGNGAQFELAMNLFATAGLAGVVWGCQAQTRRGRWLGGLVAGLGFGGATLVKQVAVLHLIVFGVVAVVSWWRSASGDGGRRDWRGLAGLAAGFTVVWGVAIGVLAARGGWGRGIGTLWLMGARWRRM